MLSAAAIVMLCASTVLAQSTTQTCRPAQVIPLVGVEAAAKITIEPPAPGPLASRGVVVLTYCAENMRVAPVFGPAALAVSPRVGHVHVTVDGAPWHWADASGNPIILQGLRPGKHKVLLELVDANHQPIDRGAVSFEVPANAAEAVPSSQGTTRKDIARHDLSVSGREVIQVLVEFAPGMVAPRHSHPGEEMAYVVEGVLEYQIDGKPPVTLKAGEALFIPAGTMHAARNVGSGKGVELATYIVEKGKPLLTLANREDEQ